MRPSPQFPADLVTFTEEILNGKFHFLCSETSRQFCLAVPKYSHLYWFVHDIMQQYPA